MVPDLRYPLRWPPDWPRNPAPRRSAFDQRRTLAQAQAKLLRQLRLAGVDESSVRISSNVGLRNDGLARSGQAQPADAGVAVYFSRNRTELVFACDRWDRVQDNVYAVAMTVGAIRAQMRWGVGSMERALAGHILPSATAPMQVAGAFRSEQNQGRER